MRFSPPNPRRPFDRQLSRPSKPRRCIRDSIQALLVPVDRCLEKLRVPVRLINDASGRLVVGGACLCDSATAPRHRHRSYTARDYYNSCVSSAPPRPPPIVKIARENPFNPKISRMRETGQQFVTFCVCNIYYSHIIIIIDIVYRLYAIVERYSKIELFRS